MENPKCLLQISALGLTEGTWGIWYTKSTNTHRENVSKLKKVSEKAAAMLKLSNSSLKRIRACLSRVKSCRVSVTLFVLQKVVWNNFKARLKWIKSVIQPIYPVAWVDKLYRSSKRYFEFSVNLMLLLWKRLWANTFVKNFIQPARSNI